MFLLIVVLYVAFSFFVSTLSGGFSHWLSGPLEKTKRRHWEVKRTFRPAAGTGQVLLRVRVIARLRLV